MFVVVVVLLSVAAKSVLFFVCGQMSLYHKGMCMPYMHTYTLHSCRGVFAVCLGLPVKNGPKWPGEMMVGPEAHRCRGGVIAEAGVTQKT